MWCDSFRSNKHDKAGRVGDAVQDSELDNTAAIEFKRRIDGDLW
jgi:hypothetical protein